MARHGSTNLSISASTTMAPEAPRGSATWLTNSYCRTRKAQPRRSEEAVVAFSRQYPEKLKPSFASSRWARHARSRSLNASRLRLVIPLSSSAATAPHWKASPPQVTTGRTGMLEGLLHARCLCAIGESVNPHQQLTWGHPSALSFQAPHETSDVHESAKLCAN